MKIRLNREKKIIIVGVAVIIAICVAICIMIGMKKAEKNNDENSSSESSASDNSLDESSASDNSNGAIDIDDSSDKNEQSDNSSNDFNGNEQSTTRPASSSGLTETGSGLEGIASKGDYNYGEALQKAILFYDLQRSGDIDEENTRSNWRGDSGMSDGADVGIDLTGGLYDAGDNVKFNLPMAYTSSVLAWSVYEDKSVYESSGQLEYILENIKWVNDYLIKCHPENDVYYYQVGDGNADHAWWGSAEVMQMNRPSFKVDINNPGSAVSAEAAASLAACAVIYKDIDPAYASECLSHAKQLYDFAERTKSDSGYTAANGFYNSWSGFYDELAWAGMWLYKATSENSYLNKAKQYLDKAEGNYKWAMCWDDVYMGACTMLAIETGDKVYKDKIEKNLDFWTTGTGSERISYTPKGLAWLDTWGSLRYATTQAFVAAVYSEWDGCSDDKAKTYKDFCISQVNYALGSTGRSFVVGFGENSPQHPHHRTSQGSWCDNMNEPTASRHTLYGALVGGPDASDGYSDTVSDFNKNEVACDYNAGFVGALAKMYKYFGGQTLKDFGAIEEIGEELYVEHRINTQSNGFVEIKAMVYNKTAWPARVTDDLELRYFIDLTEIYEAGGTASDIAITMNYAEGAKNGGLFAWNEKDNIYYVSVDFSGVKIYPGGQSAYKKEVQFRMTSANGAWDNTNDPSFTELMGTNGSELVRAVSCALYEGDTLVFGTEPGGKSVVKPVEPNSNPSGSNNNNNQSENTASNPTNTTASSGGVFVTLNQTASSGNSSTISLSFDIKNDTGSAINLSDLQVNYFFTNDGNNQLAFWCDHAATDGDGYMALTDSINGSFVSMSKDKSDTKCVISFNSGTLSQGATLTVQARVTRQDWTEFNLSNDFSSGDANKLYITKNGAKLFGEQP